MKNAKLKIFKSIYRYLLYVLAILLKWFVRYLPRSIALSLGRIGGDLCFILLSRERRRTISHLHMAFGDNVDGIARDVFRHLGMNFIEWLQMPCLTREKINNIVRATGIDNIDKALTRGKGVIILTSHLGNWEYLAAYLTLNGYKGPVVARRIYYPPYNRLLLQLRRAVGVSTLWRNGSVRSMVEALKQNKLLGILPDQDTDKVEGAFVDFFGMPAYTPTGPVSLALATGASIVPCFIVREGEGHHLYVEEPLEMVSAGSKEKTVLENTRRWSDIVERYIRRYPTQWVWMHRRWETKIKRPTDVGAPKSKIKNEDVPMGIRGSHTLINFFIFGLCFWFLVFGFWFSFAQEIPITPKTEEVKGFTMTIVDKGGREKAAISGSVANILPDGIIEILEVVARIYGQDTGGSDTLVHTAKGLYNRIKNIITTDQFVRINRRDMVITGTGLLWMPDKARLEIEENVRVEYFSESSDAGAGNPSGKRATVITSRGSGIMDYQRDIALFKKNVMVEDPDACLRAHRMKMFFDDRTQELEMVEAYGDVMIKQPKRESSSRKAVYYVGEDRIVLTGNPRIVQGLDFYTADKVTIYDRGNRVVFEPKARLVIYASTEHDI